MSAVALRVVALAVTAASFIGSLAYVVAHPKDPNAPLQPPVAEPFVLATPSPTVPATPRITLQPGVRATALPGITYTHVS